MTIKEIHETILDIISQEQPITASHIADMLNSKYNINYTRAEVNSKLYGVLGSAVVRNEFFQWSLWKNEGSRPPKYVQPEEPEDQDAINLDSTVKVGYPNGQEHLIGFSLYETIRFTPKETDITYVYCKSPIARALLGKKPGLTASVRGFAFKILQVN